MVLLNKLAVFAPSTDVGVAGPMRCGPNALRAQCVCTDVGRASRVTLASSCTCARSVVVDLVENSDNVSDIVIIQERTLENASHSGTACVRAHAHGCACVVRAM